MKNKDFIKEINFLKNCTFVIIIFLLFSNSVSAAPIKDDEAGTYIDDFSDNTGITSTQNAGINTDLGVLSLTNSGGGFTVPFNSTGSVILNTIMPLRLAKWGTLTLDSNVPEGTTIVVHVMDEGGNFYSDDILPGNGIGFSGGSIDLSALPVDINASVWNGGYKIGRIKLFIYFSTSNPSVTPTINQLSFDWSFNSGDLTPSPLLDGEWPSSDNQDGSAKRQISANFFNNNYSVLSYSATNSEVSSKQSLMLGKEGKIYLFTQGPDPEITIPSLLRAIKKEDGSTVWSRYINGGYWMNTNMAITQNGTIYTADIFSDVLMAHDGETGEVKWMYTWSGGGHGNLHAAIGPDGKIYTVRFWSDDTSLAVYAFNPDGSVAWVSYPIPSTTRVSMNNDISFGLDGNLYIAFSVFDENPEDFNDLSGQGKLYALDPDDGSTLWSYDTGDIGGKPPLVGDDGTIFVASYGKRILNKGVYAINPDGSLLWKRDIGDSASYWNSLSLRPDGVLVADRVNNFYPTQGGEIEYMNSSTGDLLFSIPKNSQNEYFPDFLITDYSGNTISTGQIYGSSTNISQYDSLGKKKWSYSTTGTGYYLNSTIADEIGNVYVSYSDRNANLNSLSAFIPWTIVSVSPSLSDEINPGDSVEFIVGSTMPANNPLTDLANAMQVVFDDDSKLLLSYSSTEPNGTNLWIGSKTINEAGEHSYTIEASASGMETDVNTHFVTPPSGSNNTGIIAQGAFTVLGLPTEIPTISSITPSSTDEDGAQFTLTVNGTDFTEDTVIYWGESALTTAFVSSSVVTALVPDSNIENSGTVDISVTNGSEHSNTKVFTINSAHVSGGGGGGGGKKKKTTPENIISKVIPGCLGNVGFSYMTGESCALNTPNQVNKNYYDLGLVTLRLGSKGEAVRQLQIFLNLKLGLNLTTDGAFGPKTLSAVKKWQKDNGLAPDGLVGPKTKTLINTGF